MQARGVPVRFSFSFRFFAASFGQQKGVIASASNATTKRGHGVHAPRQERPAASPFFCAPRNLTEPCHSRTVNRILSLVGCSGANGDQPLDRTTRAPSGWRFMCLLGAGLSFSFVCEYMRGYGPKRRGKKRGEQKRGVEKNKEKSKKRRDRPDDDDDDDDDTNSRQRPDPTVGHIAP